MNRKRATTDLTNPHIDNRKHFLVITDTRNYSVLHHSQPKTISLITTILDPKVRGRESNYKA